MADTVALIVAAGRGHRAGGDLPKQYRWLAGQSILRRCCSVFLSHPRVDAVGVVIHPDDTRLFEEATAGLDLLEPVFGGETRQESSRNGLESIAQRNPTRVLIHDAARPFVDDATIDGVLDSLDSVPAAIAAIPVNDTLKKSSEGNEITGTVDRTNLWRAQTPQGFRYQDILQAHRILAGQIHTDDSAVAEAAGLEARLVLGSEDNFKITTEADFTRAERMLRGGDIRIGAGFDVHRFGEGDHVTLCGVIISHDRGLIGHSDADVGMHAVTDAILGAVGEGDIGAHFPPGEAKWRNAESAIFLSHAVQLVTARGGAVRHIDLTLICEAPKIGPHRDSMRKKLAQIMEIPVDRISVKATTTEGLGFTGRGEGIAAQATATICL